MDLLSGGVKALFGELFAPLYLPAVIIDNAESYTTGGALRRSRDERACRAQVDRCTERMVAAEGYTDTDRAIFVLAATLEGELQTGSEITVLEGDYAGVPFRTASPIDRDPGAAYWLARGVRVKAPVNG